MGIITAIGMSSLHQFLVLYPEEVEYRVFSQRCAGVIERFLNISSVATWKSTGRVKVANQMS
jgi:hypothetical protein